MQMISAISSSISQICAEIVHQNGHDCIVTLGARFGADLQFDELDVVETIMACEEQFCVEIPDEEITTESRVSDLVALIARNLREKEGAAEIEWKDFPREVW